MLPRTPLIVLLLVPSLLQAADWPGWRGPTGMGQTTDKDLPVTWGGKNQENILWKVPLDEGHDNAHYDNNQSSPIVKGERVFVTISLWPDGVSTKQPPEHHVVCFRTTDGKRLWDTTIKPGPWALTDLRGGYTAPTPAADGDRVYALFGSSVIAALDMHGKEVWRNEIKPFAFDVAIGASPVLYKDTVLLTWDQVDKSSRLIALDCKTGEVRWEKKRPHTGWAHSTPALAMIKDKTQLLMAASNAIEGVDPDDGTTLWTCKADAKTSQRVGDTVTPVFGGGLVYCDTGRGGGPGIAVDPTGSGDVTETHLKWTISGVPEGFSSPLIVGDNLYRLLNPGVLKCWKLSTGEAVFTERLQGVTTASSPFATPEGRIYCVSAGKSHVLQAGDKLQSLAVNDLGETSQSSPAIADGKIFIKGERHLFCIGKK